MGTETHFIRPAGRHIITVGADLIKDQYAALVELVKNSYDADASKVQITFSSTKKGNKTILTIQVTDNGHGMSPDIVKNVWMIPSTKNKLNNKNSPKGRVLQGRKGIGRYAVSLLGSELILDTVDENGNKTIASINWDDFRNAEYLDGVPIEIDSFPANNPSGTDLIIQGGQKDLDAWSGKELVKLENELKKLIPPVPEEPVFNKLPQKDDFSVILSFTEDFPIKDYQGKVIDIRPFPILGYYHYRIWGHTSADGKTSIFFHNSRSSKQEIRFEKNIELSEDNENQASYCGNIYFDFRVYDRDPDSIQYLIDRGLKRPGSNEEVGRREARGILNKYNGIGVFRNGFRIRPLGDPDFDWLELNKRRVQTPSRMIGSDQVIGFVHIESEEESGLEEKAARDGLKETPEYFGLKEICHSILSELETRRFSFRSSIGLGRSKRNLDSKVQSLFQFESLKSKISKELKKFKVGAETQAKIIGLIDLQEKESTKIAQEISKIIAIYQGQATVGKIIDIVIHEGRGPLGFFKNESNRVIKYSRKLLDDCDEKKINDLISIANEFQVNTEYLVELFKKIDPLASRRGNKADFKLYKVINSSVNVFKTKLEEAMIDVTIDCDSSIKVHGWVSDFLAAFINLIDNSIYWLKQSEKRGKRIVFEVIERDSGVKINFNDNGPGIDEELIETQVIFEPDFSTKPEGGKGLGLAIAGEALSRNDFSLKAEYPLEEEGAFFIIESKQATDI